MNCKKLDKYLNYIYERNNNVISEGIFIESDVDETICQIDKKADESINRIKNMVDKLVDVLFMVGKEQKKQILLLKYKINTFQKNINFCDSSKNPEKCRQIVKQKIKDLQTEIDNLQKTNQKV